MTPSKTSLDTIRTRDLNLWYGGFQALKNINLTIRYGQIAALIEIGAEKLRYLTGVAIAVSHNGRVVQLALSDIYRKASRIFRVAESEITQATY